MHLYYEIWSCYAAQYATSGLAEVGSLDVQCARTKRGVTKWKQQGEVSYQKVLVKQDTAAAVTKVRDSRCPRCRAMLRDSVTIYLHTN